jgi:hypothetical protein
VLFVGSLERRKNHPEAFQAWGDLIACRGRRNTPLLICVGGRGWQAETAIGLLRESRALRDRVRVLPGIPDAALAALYRDSLFTLYPSRYEGWGLPVTESLSFGKVPLVADVPALRESGGDLAEYFDPRRDGDLLAKLQRLIDDAPYRAGREATILRRFEAREWRAVAQDIIEALQVLRSDWQTGAAPSPAGFDAASIELGRYYPMAVDARPQLCPGLQNGEVFRMCDAWWEPEEWGCWLKPGHAELVFRLPREVDRGWVHLDVIGNPGGMVEFIMAVAAGAPADVEVLQPGEHRRVTVRLDAASDPDRPVRIGIDARGGFPLGEVTGDMDHRSVSLGLYGFVVTREGTAPAVPRAPRCAAAALAGCRE